MSICEYVCSAGSCGKMAEAQQLDAQGAPVSQIARLYELARAHGCDNPAELGRFVRELEDAQGQFPDALASIDGTSLGGTSPSNGDWEI